MLLLLIEKLEERFVYFYVFLAFLPEPVSPQAWFILIRVRQKTLSHAEEFCFSFQLVGNVAPTLSNLVGWLQQNGSYDVAEEATAFVRSKVCYCKFGKTCNKNKCHFDSSTFKGHFFWEWCHVLPYIM